MKSMKVDVVAVDPYVKTSSVVAEFGLPAEKHVDGIYAALKDADALVFMVPHKEFLDLDLKKARGLMADGAVFVDGRRCFPVEDIKAAGFIYVGIGAGRDNA
jgi:UDP-N-acetyl-D-mannosaminuronate dehydrogenase